MTRRQPHILVLMLSASDPSVGRLCVPALQLALREAGATSAAWDIRSLPPVWVDKRELHEFPPAYSELAEAIEASDGVVLVVPIHCYAVSGSAKTVTEIVAEALTRKPVAIVTAAGSTRSHLAPRDLMTSLMLNQETICYPGTVQATEDLMQGTRPNKELRGRLADLAAHFVSFVSALQPFIDEFGAEA